MILQMENLKKKRKIYKEEKNLQRREKLLKIKEQQLIKKVPNLYQQKEVERLTTATKKWTLFQ